jgi:hypothetical protein
MPRPVRKAKPQAAASAPADASADAGQANDLEPLSRDAGLARVPTKRTPRLYLVGDQGSCFLDLGSAGVIEVTCSGDNVVIRVLPNHDGTGIKVFPLEPTKH